jgi:asparagine synthase (glutamine-hydrolysing)
MVRTGMFKGDRWKKLERYAALPSDAEKVMYNASTIFPAELKSVFGIEETGSFAFREKVLKEGQALYPKDLQRQALYYDQHLYLCSLLDRNDRTTMGASIECREPFLDPALLMGLGTLPSSLLFSGKKGKYVLCQAMKDRLPAETLRFKKIGFSVPWAHYLRNNEYLRAELDDMQRSQMFTMKFLEHINPGQLIHQFRRGDNTQVTYLLPLLTLYLWYKYYPQQLLDAQQSPGRLISNSA